MLRLKRLSLAQKLVALSTATSMIALLIASLAWVADTWVSGRDLLQQEVQGLSRLIADRSNAALAFDDIHLANQNLDTLSALPNIVIACIYDRSGNLFASYYRSEGDAGECRHYAGSIVSHVNGKIIHHYEPIVVDSDVIGGLLVRSDLSRVYRQLSHAAASALLIVFLTGLIAYVVSSRLQRVISEPVLQLSDIAREVAEEHNYQVRASKQSDHELGTLVDAFNEMLETIDIQNRSLINSRDQLEKLVEKRTSELQSSNQELEAFSYSVSHDLRAPLRSINGFSQALLDDYSEVLDDSGKDYLGRVVASADRMGGLIDDLLGLSRVSRWSLKPESIDLSAMAREVADELLYGNGQTIEVDIHPGVLAYADPTLMRSVLDNLIGNAFKYS